jgi:hypothetical protein
MLNTGNSKSVGANWVWALKIVGMARNLWFFLEGAATQCMVRIVGPWVEATKKELSLMQDGWSGTEKH